MVTANRGVAGRCAWVSSVPVAPTDGPRGRSQSARRWTSSGGREPPAHPSMCRGCGRIARESCVIQAEFRCRACGLEDHADVNGAKNILGAGLSLPAAGLAIREVTDRNRLVALVAVAGGVGRHSPTSASG
jgi:hypothetical protein